MVSTKEDKRVVFHKGESVHRDSRGTVRIVVPTDITAESFARAFTPLIKEATRLGMA